MADDDDEAAEGEGGEEHSGGSKKKLFIIVGAAVFVLLGIVAGLFFTGLLDPLLGKKHEEADAGPPPESDATKNQPPGPSSGPVAFFDMPEMIVSMNTGTKAKAAFMKIRLSLEVPAATEIPKIQNVMPRVVDNLQGYLRELKVEELKGSAGTYRLKEEMLTRIKLAVAPAKVNQVLLKDLQVQ